MGALCGGKNTQAALIHLVSEGSTLFAAPQAVILSELKLRRAKPGLVIAQENPQAGKKRRQGTGINSAGD